MAFFFRHFVNASSLLVGVTAFLLSLLATAPVLAQSGEMIPRSLLEDMARTQYAVLCQSEVFTQCMGFTGTACTNLSEAAIKQCLLPLPDGINLDELENEALESCPKQVFADAGFTEEKAGQCFDKAMEQTAE